MSMSSKDYNRLVIPFQKAREHLKQNPSDEGARVLVIIYNELVEQLHQDNGRFDHEKFADAIWPREES